MKVVNLRVWLRDWLNKPSKEEESKACLGYHVLLDNALTKVREEIEIKEPPHPFSQVDVLHNPPNSLVQVLPV